MKIVVNGQDKDLEAPLTLYNLIEQQGFVEMLIAAARNGEFVPKDIWDEVDITEGDVIDIVSPMQGG